MELVGEDKLVISLCEFGDPSFNCIYQEMIDGENKRKFQEKFQKWLDNFCLRGKCSSVRAGLKYFTRNRLPILLWVLNAAPRHVRFHHFQRLASLKTKIKKKRLYAIISFLDFHELPRLCSILSCTSSTWKFAVPCKYSNEEFWCLHIFDHWCFSK